jgi:hypothetical protein
MQLIEEGVAKPSVYATISQGRAGLTGKHLGRTDYPRGKAQVLDGLNDLLGLESFVLGNCAVVMEDAVDPLSFPPLADLANFAYLREQCGIRTVAVRPQQREDRFGQPEPATGPTKPMRLTSYLDAVESGDQKKTCCAYVLEEVPLDVDLPELADEVWKAMRSPPRSLAQVFGPLAPSSARLFIGCGQSTTGVRFDMHEILLLGIYGRRRLLLWPPADTQFLYPVGPPDFTRSSVPPFTSHDDLPVKLRPHYPLLQHCDEDYVEVILNPGDLLYIPAGWWYCATNAPTGKTVTLSWRLEVISKKKKGDEASLPSTQVGYRHVAASTAVAASALSMY